MSSDIDKASCLNDFFHSVFLPQTDFAKLFTLGEPPLGTRPLMPPVELCVSNIESPLENIDETKAPSPDGISPRVLKRCAWPIASYLYLIYKKSLSTGVLPEDWKMAFVVPIHKGGSKKEANNYRPISLTSIPCKILEHIFYKDIMKHLVQHKLLVDDQHGFCRGPSCTTQLIEFYHDLVSEVDDNGQTDCVFLRFQKGV